MKRVCVLFFLICMGCGVEIEGGIEGGDPNTGQQGEPTPPPTPEPTTSEIVSGSWEGEVTAYPGREACRVSVLVTASEASLALGQFNVVCFGLAYQFSPLEFGMIAYDKLDANQKSSFDSKFKNDSTYYAYRKSPEGAQALLAPSWDSMRVIGWISKSSFYFEDYADGTNEMRARFDFNGDIAELMYVKFRASNSILQSDPNYEDRQKEKWSLSRQKNKQLPKIDIGVEDSNRVRGASNAKKLFCRDGNRRVPASAVYKFNIDFVSLVASGNYLSLENHHLPDTSLHSGSVRCSKQTGDCSIRFLRVLTTGFTREVNVYTKGKFDYALLVEANRIDFYTCVWVKN